MSAKNQSLPAAAASPQPCGWHKGDTIEVRDNGRAVCELTISEEPDPDSLTLHFSGSIPDTVTAGMTMANIRSEE